MGKLPDGMYTRAQAARLVGRSKDTIRRWHETGIFVPSHSHEYGKQRVWLYTDEDLAVMRRLAQEIRPGRKAEKE